MAKMNSLSALLLTPQTAATFLQMLYHLLGHTSQKPGNQLSLPPQTVTSV